MLWIAWGEQGALSTHLLLRAAAAGVQRVPRCTYPAAAAGVLQRVAHGLDVTVLPQAVVHQYSGEHAIACLRLEERWADRTLLACCPSGEPVRWG